LFTIFEAQSILTPMSAILEEQAFTATRLDKEFHNALVSSITEEIIDLMLMEAIQHEVLMRNMPGFVS
jgi:hypothetical protein